MNGFLSMYITQTFQFFLDIVIDYEIYDIKISVTHKF